MQQNIELLIYFIQFRKIFWQKVTPFLDSYKLICAEQFGFEQNKSTTIAIRMIIEFIRKVIDEETYGVDCFLEFKKAFDTLGCCYINYNY